MDNVICFLCRTGEHARSTHDAFAGLDEFTADGLTLGAAWRRSLFGATPQVRSHISIRTSPA